MESKPGDHYLNLRGNLVSLECYRNTIMGNAMCGTMEIVPARARIHFKHPGFCDFHASVRSLKTNRKRGYLWQDN